MKKDVISYANAQAESASNEEIAELFRKISELYIRRLWHQFTGVVKKLVDTPEFQANKKAVHDLFEEVICDVETKMNPVSYIEIGIPISRSFNTYSDSLNFLEKIEKNVQHRSNEAFALAKIIRAKFILSENEQEDIKQILEEIDAVIDEVVGVGKVHKEYYKLASEYYRRKGNHAEYYQASLRFLGCSDLALEPKEDVKNLAVYLSLAALLGEKIFNFGVLLSHPVLEYLKGAEHEWLIEMLNAFNLGDVNKYRALKPHWSKQADLQASEFILYEKICLLALMNMTFERSSTDRLLSFADISDRTGLAKDKIELLAMKALSRGLIKGQINQVTEEISVTWVQPRVLDKSQLSTLKTKVDDWSKSITLMEQLIQNNAADILTS